MSVHQDFAKGKKYSAGLSSGDCGFLIKKKRRTKPTNTSIATFGKSKHFLLLLLLVLLLLLLFPPGRIKIFDASPCFGGMVMTESCSWIYDFAHLCYYMELFSCSILPDAAGFQGEAGGRVWVVTCSKASADFS